MFEFGRNRRGEKVLRVGQAGSGDQLINVILVIVIAAAIGFIGTDVNEEIDSSTDVGGLDGEDITVLNETTATIVFDSPNRNDDFYQVSDANRGATFLDDERAFSNTDAELTEATDYEWFPANATFKFINTTAIDNNTKANVTYNYTEKNNDFSDAKNNLSGGFADAMGLTDIVFIVLMFSVILGALLVFRVRT